MSKRTRMRPDGDWPTLTDKQRQAFLKSAQRATAGVRDSGVFLQLYSNSITTVEDATCILQLGYAIVLDKPIIIVAPHGTLVPDNVRRVARVVMFYHQGDEQSLQSAIKAAMAKVGILPEM